MRYGRRLFSSFLAGAVLTAAGFWLRPAAHAPAPPAAPAPTVAAAPAPVAAAPPVADPTGEKTGGAADVPGIQDAGNPKLAEALAAIGRSRVSINIVWTLLTGFLVMFM